MAHNKLLIILLSLSLLTACSSTHKAYLQSMKLAFESKPDPTLSLADIKSSPVDLVYARLGDRPRAILALAFIENARHKWVSADSEMLVEKSGRLAKTIGTHDNVHFVSNIEMDPISQPYNIETISYWNRTIDYGSDYINAKVESSFKIDCHADFVIDNKVAKAKLVTEYVSFTDAKGNLTSWNNLFWFDIETNTLLKTIQQLTSNSEQYNITYVSRIARLPIATILNVEE